MADWQVAAHINMLGNQLLNALAHSVASDPTSPANGQFWFDTTTGRLRIRAGGVSKSLALLDDVTAGSINSSLWDAQSVVVAVNDNSPNAVIIPEQAFVGRITGGDIGAVTAAQARTMLSLPASGSVATESFVTTAIDNLINGASAAVDTLQELATLMEANQSGITAINTAIAERNRTYAVNIGDGSATTITAVHNFNTEDLTVSSRFVADDAPVILDWRPVSPTAIDIALNSAPTTDQIRVVVQG